MKEEFDFHSYILLDTSMCVCVCMCYFIYRHTASPWLYFSDVLVLFNGKRLLPNLFSTTYSTENFIRNYVIIIKWPGHTCFVPSISFSFGLYIPLFRFTYFFTRYEEFNDNRKKRKVMIRVLEWDSGNKFFLKKRTLQTIIRVLFFVFSFVLKLNYRILRLKHTEDLIYFVHLILQVKLG